MIDLEKAQKAFKKYISKYNLKDEKIKLKIAHIERTSQKAKYIAEKLELEKEDIELATLIGLLHDIGRFEQARIYKTFVDTDSVNHAVQGIHDLFDTNVIREFIEDNKYDKLIRKAIFNHNANKIEKGLSEKENLHAKIIRDADKMDIFYVLTIGDVKAIWESEDFKDQKISDEIYREYMENHKIIYANRTNSADILVSHFAYVFDFNYKFSLKYIYQNNYIDDLYKRFKFTDEATNKRYNEIYKTAKNFVEEAIK